MGSRHRQHEVRNPDTLSASTDRFCLLSQSAASDNVAQATGYILMRQRRCGCICSSQETFHHLCLQIILALA